jgi:acetoin utilization deacetylase AcuC-like enzyme
MVADRDAVPVVWSPTTRLHDIREEIWVGVPIEGTEVPARVDTILERLGRLGGYRPVEPETQDETALRAVHDPAMLEFLSSAASRWQAGGYEAEVGQDRVVPYLFPTPALTEGMPVRTAVRVHAEAGRFGYDTCTLVGPGTWEAARAAADCAIAAARLVVDGAPVAYALCRPPGHHATRSGYGGSCYLNNAALAAHTLREAGHARVGVIDLDAHQGNGTAQIFYARGDVSYASVHVDPGAGWFPHVLGYADETGTGAGEGATRNLPLPEGTDDETWLSAVRDAVRWTGDHGCTAVVVSLGVDAAVDDPESPLAVTEAGYQEAGRLVGALDLPAVVVQEGGYHLPTLGHLVAAYLDGHAGLRRRGTLDG